MTHMETARLLRADTQRHYNCAQSVLCTFAQEMGMSREQAYQLGAHFGSGMRHGSTCGVLTASLMILGMLGYDETRAAALMKQLREEHGALDCATLLKGAHENGIPRKEHCDGLVYELVQAMEAVLEKP